MRLNLAATLMALASSVYAVALPEANQGSNNAAALSTIAKTCQQLMEDYNNDNGTGYGFHKGNGVHVNGFVNALTLGHKKHHKRDKLLTIRQFDGDTCKKRHNTHRNEEIGKKHWMNKNQCHPVKEGIFSHAHWKRPKNPKSANDFDDCCLAFFQDNECHGKMTAAIPAGMEDHCTETGYARSIGTWCRSPQDDEPAPHPPSLVGKPQTSKPHPELVTITVTEEQPVATTAKAAPTGEPAKQCEKCLYGTNECTMIPCPQ